MVVGGRHGRAAGFLRPVARARQIFQEAAIDPGDALRGLAVVGIDAAGRDRVARVGEDRDVLAEDGFAEPRAATFFCGEAAPLVGGTRVEIFHHHADEVGYRGGLEDDGIISRRQPLGFPRTDGLVDGRGAHRGRVEPREIVQGRAGPAGAGAVGRPRGDGVEHVGLTIVNEKPLARGEAGKAGADLEEARGLEFLRLGLLEHRLQCGRERGGRGRLRAVEKGTAGRVLLGAERRHELGIFRRALGRRFRGRDERGQCRVVEVGAGGRAGTLAVMRLDADLDAVRRAARRRHVLREADVPVLVAVDRDDARVGLRQGEDLVSDGLRGRLVQDHAAAFRPVFRTVTCRKRPGTAPCETGALCSGWPLPQFGAPPRK